MKISIIVPIHNLEKQITHCLNSIFVQDFNKDEFEVLLVLDSCTDNTGSVVREWHNSHRDMKISILYSQGKTPGSARNVGLDNAEGEFIMFIDGDDKLINYSALSILYNNAQGHNAVRVTDHVINGTHVKFSDRLTLWLHFFSRELIGNDRFTDMLLNEDYEFVKRIREKPGYDEAIVDVPLYYYNYDNERMLCRIKEVRKATHERKQQGLPPLYISDNFVANKEVIRRLINKNA